MGDVPVGVGELELEPVPRRLARGERHQLRLALLVLVPLLLLLLVPPALGLDRFVITDHAMDGTISRGSVVLAREVPTSDLGVGDVITFERPGPEHGLVTRRIVALEGTAATTRGDASRTVDPWTLDLVAPAYPRLLFAVPWVGYPFTGDIGSGGWVFLALVAAVALALAARPWDRLRKHRRQRPPGVARHLHA
jgi:signal peptidase